MKNREEAIKAFFDDEEKIKAIADDKEFLNKVSGGEATPKTYKEEFKKLGLDLTDEEAAQTAEMINEIRSTPTEKLPEKLNDLSLGDISGGEVEFTPEQNDNSYMQWQMDREAQRRAEIGWITGGSIAGGIAAAGVLTVFVGLECRRFAALNALSASRAAKNGKTESAAKFYSNAKKLSWMFPKDKAYYDSKLKAPSK